MTMNSKMLRIFVASLAGLGAAVAAMGTGGLPGAAVSCQRSVAIDPQVTVSEATGTLTFVVHTNSCPTAGSVSYVVADGTAGRPGDFLLGNGYLSWGTGDTSSRTITAAIVNDGLREAPLEDFRVTLVEPSGGVRVASAAGQGRIFDNDTGRHQATVDGQVCLIDTSDSAVPPTRSPSPTPAPQPVPSASTCTIEPGHIVIAPIVLNSPNPTDETLRVKTSDGDLIAGLDYLQVDRTVTIPALTIAVFIHVKLLPHAFVHGGHFNIHISDYTGGGEIIEGDAKITVVP